MPNAAAVIHAASTERILLKTNLIANYVGQGWRALVNIAFVPVYVHYLGIEAYGIIGLFSLLQAWLTLLDFGMTPTLSREMACFIGGTRDTQSIRNLLRSIEVVAYGIAAVIAVAILSISNWLASEWLTSDEIPTYTVAQAFSIMGLATALGFVESIYRSAIVGLQRQVLLNAVSSGISTLRALGAIAVLVWISPTITAFFVWQCSVSVVSLLVFALIVHGLLPKSVSRAKFSFDALRSVRQFAGGMIGITLLATIMTQADKLILSKILSLSEFGYYTLAAMVAAALFNLAGPITQAWFPRLSQLHALSDESGIQRTYHSGAQLVSVVVGSAAIVMALFSDTLLELWTQDKTIVARTARLVTILAFGNLLNSLMWMPHQTQLAYGWTSLSLRINLVSVFLIVPAILIVTPRFGSQGAAWVWVALNAGYLLVGVQVMYLRILVHEKWRWYLQDIVYPLTAATTASLFVRYCNPHPATPFGQFVSIFCAAVLSLMCSAMFSSHVRNAGRVGLTRILPTFPKTIELK